MKQLSISTISSSSDETLCCFLCSQVLYWCAPTTDINSPGGQTVSVKGGQSSSVLTFSTVLNPDGPHGPAFVLKKGILHLSLKSCVPVVAVQFSSSSFHEIKTWDRKKYIYPFSTIEMIIGEPIYVTSDNFAYAHDLIERELG